MTFKDKKNLNITKEVLGSILGYDIFEIRLPCKGNNIEIVTKSSKLSLHIYTVNVYELCFIIRNIIPLDLNKTIKEIYIDLNNLNGGGYRL